VCVYQFSLKVEVRIVGNLWARCNLALVRLPQVLGPPSSCSSLPLQTAGVFIADWPRERMSENSASASLYVSECLLVSPCLTMQVGLLASAPLKIPQSLVFEFQSHRSNCAI